MKKTLTMMALALLVFVSACKKDENETPAGKNTWTLNGTVYTVAYTNSSPTSTSNTLVIFADAPFNATNVNTFNLSFKAAPTASGTYKLTSTTTNTLANNQVQLFAGSAAAVYAYIGTDVDIQVTVTGGKVSVIIPEVSLKSASGQPEGKLSAAVYEM